MRIRLSCELTLKEIALAVGGNEPPENTTVTHLVTDSRMAKRGDLFVALRGEKYDGNEFIDIVNAIGAFTLGNGTEATIRIESGEIGLLSLANYYKRRLKKLRYTVGITGSVGKTTTKEFLAQMLSDVARVHKTPENMNNAIGLPLTVLSAPSDTEILILEMGMNHRGEIAALSKCAEPDIAIITNIGTAHIGNLGSRRAIAEAKAEITEGLHGTLITPSDEPLLDGIRAYRFGINDTSADLNLSVPAQGLSAKYSDGKMLGLTFFSRDTRNLLCLAPALCAMRLMNFNFENIKDGVSKISDENTRQKMITLAGITMICDFYNASFESFSAAITALSELRAPAKKCVLIGDMLELGSYAEGAHKELGALAARLGIDKIFAFGVWAEAVALGAVSAGFSKDSIFINGDISRPDITARQILDRCDATDTVLLKASRGTRLERVTEAITYFTER